MDNLFGNSAITLQRQSPTRWTFSKVDRFKSPKNLPSVDYISPPSTMSPRSTSLGFGSKWELKNTTGNDGPPPGTYNIPSTLNKNLGPRLVKHSVLPLIPTRYITPGPGAYNPNNNGSNSPRYSFRERNRAKIREDGPSPGSYDPKFTHTEFSPFKNLAFGCDSRKFNSKPKDTGPGPGHYNI